MRNDERKLAGSIARHTNAYSRSSRQKIAALLRALVKARNSVATTLDQESILRGLMEGGTNDTKITAMETVAQLVLGGRKLEEEKKNIETTGANLSCI